MDIKQKITKKNSLWAFALIAVLGSGGTGATYITDVFKFIKNVNAAIEDHLVIMELIKLDYKPEEIEKAFEKVRKERGL